MKPMMTAIAAGISVAALVASGVLAADNQTVPAWAAEATMNPDYAPEAATQPQSDATEVAPPASDETIAAAEPPAAASNAASTGVTSYFGGTSTIGAPFAADAAMNPDYTAAADATTPSSEGASDTAAAAPAAEPELPLTPPGFTSFYGDTTSTSGAPFAAEATLNPGYSAAEPQSAATPAVAAATSNAGSCAASLNAAITSGSLTFAIGKTGVLPSSYATLDKVAETAKSCGGSIEVGGHTDNTGSEQDNKVISELRAASVVKYLTQAGVDASKLRAVGYGEAKPVASNDSPAGRRQNRRIEFGVSE